ncbi:hypothetical protein [Streptomyces eurythermus]|uniref:hypothetical protein n=1 Tax=Streptomyces eurythermus TaxID=42237 RepID=UPI0036F5F582
MGKVLPSPTSIRILAPVLTPTPGIDVRTCGGDAVSADAAKALMVITGSSWFEASGKEYSVGQAATEIAEAFCLFRVPELQVERVGGTCPHLHQRAALGHAQIPRR